VPSRRCGKRDSRHVDSNDPQSAPHDQGGSHREQKDCLADRNPVPEKWLEMGAGRTGRKAKGGKDGSEAAFPSKGEKLPHR